ncbi:MAG: hypothetical protein WAW75_03145 [Gallionella sp.]
MSSTKKNINAATPFLVGKEDRISPAWYKIIASLIPGGRSVQVPLTGFSITIPNGIEELILAPSGALATGEVIMPSGAGDGDNVKITSTYTITALTVTAAKGQTIKNSPTTLVASLVEPYGYEFVFDADSATWYRIK